MRELVALPAVAGQRRAISGTRHVVNDQHGDTATVHERNSRARTARAVLGVILLVILVALVADNRSNVRVGWVIGDGEMPLAVVLTIAALAGAAIGWLLLHRPGRRGHRT